MKFVQIHSTGEPGSEDILALDDQGVLWVWDWPQPIKAKKQTATQLVYATVGYTAGSWIKWEESEVAKCNKCVTEERLQQLRDQGYEW